MTSSPVPGALDRVATVRGARRTEKWPSPAQAQDEGSQQPTVTPISCWTSEHKVSARLLSSSVPILQTKDKPAFHPEHGNIFVERVLNNWMGGTAIRNHVTTPAACSQRGGSAF